MGQVNAPQLQTPMAYDPTTQLWLPLKVRPLLTDPLGGEEYGILSVYMENATPLGQATMLNSAPVVIASDQSNVPVLDKNAAWFNIFSTTQTAVSAWSGSGDMTLDAYSQLYVSCQVTAITGTSIQFRFQRKDSFGNYASLWTATAQTTTGGVNSSVGPGFSTNHAIGHIGALTAILTAITSVTFTVDIWVR